MEAQQVEGRCRKRESREGEKRENRRVKGFKSDDEMKLGCEESAG